MGTRITVHVTPRAGRDEIGGWRGDELQVRVTAAPEGGKANAVTCEVLAEALCVPKSAVRVVRGETSRHKLVDLHGVGMSEVRAAFGEPDASLF